MYILVIYLRLLAMQPTLLETEADSRKKAHSFVSHLSKDNKIFSVTSVIILILRYKETNNKKCQDSRVYMN